MKTQTKLKRRSSAGPGKAATQFKKGQSGNPAGMVKGTKHKRTEFMEFLRDEVDSPGFQKRIRDFFDDNPKVCMWAAEMVKGKATQRVEHSGGEDFGARNVSVVLVLHQEIAAMMAEGLVTREVRDRLRGCLSEGEEE